MRSGKYKYPIKIYQPYTLTDEYGEQTKVYRYTRNTKAAILWEKGVKTAIHQELFIPNQVQITVHSYIEITDDTRIEYDGKMYEVISWHKDLQYNDKILIVEEVNG